MLYLGVDYHKKRSVATLINEKGHIKGRFKIVNQDIDTTLNIISSKFEDQKIKTAMESTMNWGLMYDKLSLYFGHSVLVDPRKMKIISESTNKNDKVDSNTLAQFLRMDYLPEVYAPSPEVRIIKDLIRHRLFLVRSRTRVINRIHLLLIKEGILGNKILDKDREWGILTQKGKDIIFKKSQSWSEERRRILNDSFSLKDEYTQKIKEIENKFFKLWNNSDPIIQRLMTIPGIGLITAVTLRYEIDNIKRFKNSRKLVRYCGLCPSTKSSDEKKYNGKIVMSRNQYLQTLFIECTLGAMKKEPKAKDYYYHVKGITKKSNSAKVALARKLCELTFNVWNKGSNYESKYF